MSWDDEESDWDRERREKLEKDRAEITALCAELEELLRRPCPQTDALSRQTELLDCLFYTLLRRNLNTDKENGQISHDNLEMALRLQKQCVDTAKAAEAAHYMNGLAEAARRRVLKTAPYAAPAAGDAPYFSCHPEALPPPHPLKNRDQTDETENP